MAFVDIYFTDGSILGVPLSNPGDGIPIPSIDRTIERVVINHPKFLARVEGYHTYYFRNEALVTVSGIKKITHHIGGIRSDGSCHGYIFDKQNIGQASFDLTAMSPQTLAVLLKEGSVKAA